MWARAVRIPSDQRLQDALGGLKLEAVQTRKAILDTSALRTAYPLGQDGESQGGQRFSVTTRSCGKWVAVVFRKSHDLWLPILQKSMWQHEPLLLCTLTSYCQF